MKTLLALFVTSGFLFIGCQASPNEPPFREAADYARLAERGFAIQGYTARLMPNVAPVEIAPHLAPNVDLIGTIVTEDPTGTTTQVFLDLPLSPLDAARSLTDAFSLAGWYVVGQPAQVESMSNIPGKETAFSILCRNTDATLSVLARRLGQSNTSEVDILVTKKLQGTGGCVEQTIRESEQNALFPQLQLLSRGQRIGAAGLYPMLRYELFTSASAAVIEEDVANQLQLAGWKQVGKEATTETAWSLWLLIDGEGRTWAATVNIAPSGRGSSRMLTLQTLPLGHNPLTR